MRFFLGLSLLLLSCGTPQPKPPVQVIAPADTVSVAPDPIPVEEVLPVMPKGAVSANYRSGEQGFYAYVKAVDPAKQTTLIAFEENQAPEIVISESRGAELSSLRFGEFDSDLLLVNTSIKDPDFNKYYLYKLTNQRWKLVVNGWAIHKNNKPDTLDPIVVDTKDPNKMRRYYSVFDLDKNSKLGYTWRLLQESIDRLD